ncbi:MAG: efflux RND transporter periplasmic adaptor subunit [Betaproteobacteria bacterium]|nr:MAG: efflux RND transporter periplasmic adaptor subunit [Betaproteobacteria bacterium]
MNKAVIGVAAILVVVAGAVGFWLGHQGDASKSSAAPAASVAAAAPAVAVEAVQVNRLAMPQGITAVGSLRSDESITLRPEVAGRISAIQFREGERVAKGAPLVKLDPSVTRAELQQAQANMTLAKAKYDRAIDLQGKGFISGQAKDEAENNLKVAEASLALAQAKLAKLSIEAPFSGIIGLRSVSVGDYVKEGADMVNLEAIDPLKVDFRVPEIYLSQIHVGQSLQMSLDAVPGKTYEGKVFAINPNQDTTLRPGMFARVRLLTRDAQEALVVPEQAIVPQGDEWFVYRIIDGKAQRARVEIGQRRGGKAEVLKGLRDGDIVITAGQLKIRDGVPVQVAAVQSAPAAPPNADAGVIAAPSAPPAPPKGDAVPAAPAKADAAAPVPKS